MQDRLHSRSLAAGHALSWLLPVAVTGSLAWFVLPVLGATFNEGFQTTIAMNAQALGHGGLGSVDPLYPLNNDFMVFSRFGITVLLAGLTGLGLPAETAFRLVMAAGLAGLLWANAALLVWRYRLPIALALIPSLLMPGVFESAWFFNDNVLSAALTSAAILLFWRRPTLGGSAGAAVLWGLAVACRSDAVLLAPAFAILGWWTRPSWPIRLRHALLAGPIAVAVPILVYGAFGLDLLQILPLTRQATALWARTDTWVQVVQQGVKAFSPPGLLALAIGTVATVVRRRWLEAALCVAVPALYVLAYGRMLTEVRYLLPLSPFFGIATVEAWAAVTMAGRARRRLAGGAFAVLALLCVMPPWLPPTRLFSFMAADHDMPRPPLGRFWSPIPALWWNARLSDGTAALRDALTAEATSGGTAVVVSTYWTPDRAVDLLLREEGFALAQADRPAACRYGAEHFVRGTATVVHLRPHLPMMPTERSGLNWERWDVPCLQALGAGGDTPVLVAGWMEVGHPSAALTAPGVTPLFVPPRGTGPASALEDRRYALLVARAPASLVPSLLEPASDPLARRLALEAAASAERPGPENPFAYRIENKIISRAAR